MLHDPTFWVFIGFVIFVGLILYLKLPGQVLAKLVERTVRIKAELEQAEKLHNDAKALLAKYQAQRQNALTEAQAIVAQAQAEAKRQAEAAEQELVASIARRQAMAEQKIAQAEAQALKDVRVAAVDLAVAAAERLLTGALQGDTAAALVDGAIGDVRTRLSA
jgi:F-type H+-transporting ATPase subunit b